MEMKKLLICVVVGMLLLSPVLAKFQGKEGEKSVYELFHDDISIGKATSYIEGRFKIGGVVARRFSLTEEAQKNHKIKESSLSISHDGGFAIAVVAISTF